MKLKIDDPDSERLILALSTLTGETPEHVLLNALSERLEREKLKKLRNNTSYSIAKGFESLLNCG